MFFVLLIDYLTVVPYNIDMNNEKYFLHPVYEWQRRYEALRASFVDRLPARFVADKFKYSENYIRLLRHQFMHGKIDFSEPVPEGKSNRRSVPKYVREKIIEYRKTPSDVEKSFRLREFHPY